MAATVSAKRTLWTKKFEIASLVSIIAKWLGRLARGSGGTPKPHKNRSLSDKFLVSHRQPLPVLRFLDTEALDELSVLEHRDFRRVRRHRRLVRHHDDGFVVDDRQIAEQFAHRPAVGGIEVAGGLI